MNLVYMTCLATSLNGVPIGMTVIAAQPKGIPRGRLWEITECAVEEVLSSNPGIADQRSVAKSRPTAAAAASAFASLSELRT